MYEWTIYTTPRIIFTIYSMQNKQTKKKQHKFLRDKSWVHRLHMYTNHEFIDFHTNSNPFTFRWCFCCCFWLCVCVFILFFLFFFSIYLFSIVFSIFVSLFILSSNHSPICRVCDLFADCRYLFISFIRDVLFISLVSTSSLLYICIHCMYVCMCVCL